ncbi:unnamed protein product, partial [Amoebophrya sp. A120]
GKLAEKYDAFVFCSLGMNGTDAKARATASRVTHLNGKDQKKEYSNWRKEQGVTGVTRRKLIVTTLDSFGELRKIAADVGDKW